MAEQATRYDKPVSRASPALRLRCNLVFPNLRKTSGADLQGTADHPCREASALRARTAAT